MIFHTVTRAFGRRPRASRPYLAGALIAAAGVAVLSAAAPAWAAPYNPEQLPAAQLSQIDETCRAVIGLGEFEARYFACVGALSHAASDAGTPSYSPAVLGPEPGLKKHYPYASSRELRYREQLSCGRLGLDPTGEPFAKCVARLDTALFNADNPTQ